MNSSRIIVGGILIIIGLSFLTNFPIFRYLWPLFIILIGLRILMGRNHWNSFSNQTVSSENILKRICIFSAINTAIKSNNFQGGEVTAIFGGGEVNLKNTSSKEKVINLNVIAIFGGLKIIVPDNWRVNANGMGIFGGFDNKTILKGKEITLLQIDGTALFGGVEIVN